MAEVKETEAPEGEGPEYEDLYQKLLADPLSPEAMGLDPFAFPNVYEGKEGGEGQGEGGDGEGGGGSEGNALVQALGMGWPLTGSLPMSDGLPLDRLPLSSGGSALTQSLR